jgi:hypothetical protein
MGWLRHGACGLPRRIRYGQQTIRYPRPCLVERFSVRSESIRCWASQSGPSASLAASSAVNTTRHRLMVEVFGCLSRMSASNSCEAEAGRLTSVEEATGRSLALPLCSGSKGQAGRGAYRRTSPHLRGAPMSLSPPRTLLPPRTGSLAARPLSALPRGLSRTGWPVSRRRIFSPPLGAQNQPCITKSPQRHPPLCRRLCGSRVPQFLAYAGPPLGTAWIVEMLRREPPIPIPREGVGLS